MEVRIQRFWHKNTTGIWIMERRNNESYVAEPMELKFKSMGLNVDCFHLPEPTIEIANEIQYQFLDSFAAALAEQGYAKSNEKVQGMYDAQSKHLEDMRKLVFKGEMR